MLSSSRLLLFKSTRTSTRTSRPQQLIRFFHASHQPHYSQQPTTKTALVLGSSGALGTAVTRHFLQRGNSVNVIGADVVDSAETPQFHGFVPLPPASQDNCTLAEVTHRLTQGVSSILEHDDALIDVIVVASGGWESDPERHANASVEENIEENALAYGDSVDRMMRMNLYPVLAAGYVAQHYMNHGGLYVAIGATAALSPTPNMMGYGCAKTAAHHAVQTMGSMTGLGLTTKAQRKKTIKVRQDHEALDEMTVVGLLPSKIDTQSNRLAEPKADFDKWTKPSDMAKEIGAWMDEPHLRPHSGSLIKVFSSADGATFQLAR